MFEIIVICHSCEHDNKMANDNFDWNDRNKDTPIDKDTEFSFFSDAHKHMLENPDHVMNFAIKQTTK